MRASLPVRLGGGLVLIVLLGAGAVRAEPAGMHGLGQWPAGLAAGLLLLAPQTRRRVPAVALLLAASFASMLLGGRSWEVGLGSAVAMGLGAVLAVWTLEQGGTSPPQLWTSSDLARFCGGVALGAFGAADTTLLVSLATGFGPPGALFVSTFIGTAASLGVLLPFFLDCSPHDGQAGTTERAVAWAMLLGATVGIFVFTDVPGAGFVIIPLLGWSGLRLTMREALFQVLMVTVASSLFTSLGTGPFADVDATAGRHEVLGVLISLFVLDCVFIVVPLSMSVGQQQRKASEAFLEREKLQHVLSSATGMAIIGTDQFGRINLFNPGAEFLLGYSAEEVMGRSPAIFHTAEEIATQAERLGVEPDFVTVSLAQAAKPKPWSADWEFRRKDGEIRSMAMTLAPVTDDHGNVTGYVSTVDDVTERVRSQEALVAALEAERSAVSRLREVDEVKDAFVSTVSHELRTPITNIIGYVELLEDGVYGDPTGDQLSALQRVAQNSERLLALIEDLLVLSRLDEPEMRLESRLIDLRHVLATVHDMLAPTLATRHLDFRVVVPQLPVAVNGDMEKLERMVVNLAGNAVKYTPDGGQVLLQLQQHGTSAVIEVSDTGLGIPAQEVDSLFRRFYRSSVAEQRAIQGTGLGLSIAKSIATHHGGSVSVESELGKGSTFRVALPCLEGATTHELA